MAEAEQQQLAMLQQQQALEEQNLWSKQSQMDLIQQKLTLNYDPGTTRTAALQLRTNLSQSIQASRRQSKRFAPISGKSACSP